MFPTVKISFSARVPFAHTSLSSSSTQHVLHAHKQEFHDSSEEEEDDEEEGAEELQDFLADSEEDEEGAEGEGAGAEGEKKKKKKKKRRLGRLDEDDYALLEEQVRSIDPFRHFW